jgi:hypothetical protein
MASRMNKAYWLANKAKTLGAVDKTVAAKVLAVTNALEKWDTQIRAKAPKDWFVPNIDDILKGIVSASTALKAVATKVVHDATIKLLEYYIESATKTLKEFESATGAYWAGQFKNGAISAADQALIKSIDPLFWATKLENYEYLAAMKTSGNRGSAALYNKFVLGQGGEKINVNPRILAKMKVAHEAGNYDSDKGWLEAKSEILGMLTQTSSFGEPMKVIQQKHFIKKALAL